jgi:hypothetical protein
MAPSVPVDLPAAGRQPRGVERVGVSRWFLVNVAVVAMALLGSSEVFSQARLGADWATLGFWSSVLLIYAPVATRLVWPDVPRAERIALVAILGLALYLVKILHTPVDLALHDEFLHWRTAEDILEHQQLFTVNPLMPISALYPGLEILTAGIAQLGGISVPVAGVILIGAVRLVTFLSLYLFFERITSSDRLASLAVAVYAANSSCLFFHAQFAYETVALAFGTALLFAAYVPAGPILRSVLVVALALAMACTHHMTTYVFGALFLLLAVASLVFDGWSRRVVGLAATGALCVAAAMAWNSALGGAATGYLLPDFSSSAIEFWGLVTGHGATRRLFEGAAGTVAPVAERVAAISSVAVISISLCIGWLCMLRMPWRGATTALALLACAYPFSLALRLTQSGWELASRSTGFIFIGIALVIAVAIVRFWAGESRNPLRILFVAALMTLAFAGGVISGSPPWQRVPGPYLVSADSRSLSSLGVDVAHWAKENLGAGNRFVADRINRLLLATYGDQWPITSLETKVDTSPLALAEKLGQPERDAIKSTGADYILVDRRLSQGLPVVGVYFERGEYGSAMGNAPTLPALDKFERVRGADFLLDTGNIRIYSLGGVDAR